MGWQDRSYYRDSSGSTNPLVWLLTGRVALFNVFGIQVYAHASLILYAAITLLLGMGRAGFYWQDRVMNVSVLFLVVLLHEFGHCFAARWVGGEADEILMHPLGGLALTRPPHPPLPMFLTLARGPAVSVLICLVCGVILWSVFGWVPWNPFRFHPIPGYAGWL